jgi:hypothetical protein
MQLAALATMAAWWQGACAGSEILSCSEIPAGGCPSSRGGSCDDGACHALYDCVAGDWQLAELCPAGSGGQAAGGGSAGQGAVGGAAGAGGAAGGAGEAGTGGCPGALLDHSGEVTGCVPELLLPDCPVIAAETCQPCLTGCLDFFLCLPVGWLAVAYCDEHGTLVVEQ